jgi:SAM-dependent methyltransferase
MLPRGSPTCDPRTFFNTRARDHASDPIKAVCLDDPEANICIDRIQHRVLTKAMRHVAERGSLADLRVLDYGCGPGRWVSFLRAEGCAYSGVDIADEMLAIARRRHPGVEFGNMDSDRIPYADNTFDLVWCIAVLHHNPYPAQEAIISEMARVLRDDGSLVLFEGLGSDKEEHAGYHPRPLHEWLVLAGRQRLSCRWQLGANYWLLRALVGQSVNAALWRKRLTRIDAIIDPYLLPLVPRRWHKRAAMVFRKQPA